MENFEAVLRYKNEIEDAYGSILAPYAAKKPICESRRYVEEERPDENRASFQRDRDRIIHSGAFRRMMYKTQVFVNHEGDHFRTRLTHSLEVAQLSRGIAKSLALNEDLTEAIALGHDLGHTPFGHAAEAVLGERLEEVGLGGFYHNEQSVRVVDELENRDDGAYQGLNLTYEVREGMLKHNSDRTGALGELLPNCACSSLEGQIVRLCDTAAYTCHDLDDGIKAKILENNCRKNPDIEKEFNEIRERIKDETGILITYGSLGNHGFIGRLTHYFISRLTVSGFENIKRLNIRNREDVMRYAKENKNIIEFDFETNQLFRALKKFVGKSVYQTSTVQMMDNKAKRVTGELFDAFNENVCLLPAEWRYKTAHFSELGEYRDCPDERAARYRIISDYISCMTDRYALEEYERVFNPNVKI